MFDYIHCVLLGILSVVAIIGAVVLLLWLIFGETRYRWLALPPGVALATALTWWWVYSAMMPPEIAFIEQCPIKTVEFPNGRHVQMFHADGRDHNANVMFAGMVPEGAHVQRVVYRRIYFGVYYGENESSMLRDRYSIVAPEKKANRHGDLVPGL